MRFNGFFPKPQSGTYLILDEGGYQVAGQKGTWLVSDEVEVDGQRFVQMRSEQTKNPPPSIILHESGAFVTQTALGFDGEATRKMRAFLQGPKPELLHHQKFFENGTAERAKESGTEQKYNMIDFPSTTSTEKISIGAERQRRYRATKKLRAVPTGEHLWEVVLMYQKVRFKTYSGLPFSYEIRKGRSGEYTRELWIDRRENSKSLAWSSVLLALGNVKEVGAVVDRPKALGDIRGVTYIYGMFYRFGLIDVPDDAKRKMNKNGCVSKG